MPVTPEPAPKNVEEGGGKMNQILLNQLLEQKLKTMKPEEISKLLNNKDTPLKGNENNNQSTPVRMARVGNNPLVKSPSDVTIYKPAFMV